MSANNDVLRGSAARYALDKYNKQLLALIDFDNTLWAIHYASKEELIKAIKYQFWRDELEKTLHNASSPLSKSLIDICTQRPNLLASLQSHIDYHAQNNAQKIWQNYFALAFEFCEIDAVPSDFVNSCSEIIFGALNDDFIAYKAHNKGVNLWLKAQKDKTRRKIMPIICILRLASRKVLFCDIITSDNGEKRLGFYSSILLFWAIALAKI